MGMELNKKCPKCGKDNWECLDKTKWYIEWCTNCKYSNEITKQDFIDTFQCPECNCLEGTLEENKKFIAVRCKHCDKQTIVLEKHTTVDHRSKTIETNQNNVVNNNKPKCPTCSSTDIRKIGTGERAVSILGLGILSKKINKTWKCNNCGYTW